MTWRGRGGRGRSHRKPWLSPTRARHLQMSANLPDSARSHSSPHGRQQACGTTHTRRPGPLRLSEPRSGPSPATLGRVPPPQISPRSAKLAMFVPPTTRCLPRSCWLGRQSFVPGVAACAPVPRNWHEIKRLDHDPKLLPRNMPGKSGVKSDVMDALKSNALFQAKSSFKKAWERLLQLQDIAYADRSPRTR